MPRPSQSAERLSLYDYIPTPMQTVSLRRPRAREPLNVVDDWQECVPITSAELDVLEIGFTDILDGLL